MNLTEKEKEMLQEALEHERICTAKYQNYSEQLQDPQLKNLFEDLKNKEENQVQTISQLLQQGGVST